MTPSQLTMNWGIYDKIKNEWYSILKDTGTPVSTAAPATIARTWILWWNLATEIWRELCQLLLRKFSSLFKRGQREEIHPSSSSFGFCCIWNMMPRTAVFVLRSRKGASLRQRRHMELCQAEAASERRSWSPTNLTDCLPYFWVLLVMRDTGWAGRDC